MIVDSGLEDAMIMSERLAFDGRNDIRLLGFTMCDCLPDCGLSLTMHFSQQEYAKQQMGSPHIILLLRMW